MAGYSGTPLPKKLGLAPGKRVSFLNLPADVKAELAKALAECENFASPRPSLDYAHVFVRSQAELKKQFSRFSKPLASDGILWVSWPKKTSGVATDLTENDVRKIGLDGGMVDVKVCAVSDVWSGLKFVFRVKDREKRKV
jgi:hypothetical protein